MTNKEETEALRIGEIIRSINVLANDGLITKKEEVRMRASIGIIGGNK